MKAFLELVLYEPRVLFVLTSYELLPLLQSSPTFYKILIFVLYVCMYTAALILEQQYVPVRRILLLYFLLRTCHTRRYGHHTGMIPIFEATEKCDVYVLVEPTYIP